TASRLGVTTQAIDNTVYDAFGQRQVSTMHTRLNQYHVIMEVDPALLQYPDSLNYIYVPTSRGRQAPLGAFTTFGRSNTPLSISHSGQFPSTTISFNLAPRHALGNAVAEIAEAEREI